MRDVMKPLFLAPRRSLIRCGCLILMSATFLLAPGFHLCDVASAESWMTGQASRVRSLQAGMPAPAFSSPDVDGKAHSLKEWAGKRVALCFFCGCEPCHEFA